MACNMCAMCGGSSITPNYQKQVDPHVKQYGTILGDAPQRENRRNMGGNMAALQVCLPTFACPPPQPPCPGRHNPGQQPAIVNMPRDSGRVCSPYNAAPPPSPARHNPGQQPCIVNVPRDCAKECPKIVCEPCPPMPPTKVWLIKSSPMPQKVGLSSLLLFLLSSCLPVGSGPCGGQEGCGGPQTAKLMICLPCAPQMKEPGKKNVYGQEGCASLVQQAPCGQKRRGAKYLPPPVARVCPEHCIHRCDLKGERPCTYHQGIPCVAHCFASPL